MRLAKILLLSSLAITACGEKDKNDSEKDCTKTAEGCPQPSPTPAPAPSPEPKPNPDPQPQPNPKPDPAPNPQPSPKPEPKPQPQPTPTPNPNPAPQPNPGPSDCYKGDALTCDIEKRILDKTNKYRSEVSASALANSQECQFASRDWSKQQAAAGNISHTGFPEARNSAIAKEFPGSKVTVSGENVAMFGFVPGLYMGQGMLVEEIFIDGLLVDHRETPMSAREYEAFLADAEQVAEKFATMWRNSSGHYKNMVDKSFTKAGMGVFPKGNGYYGTQLFAR